MALYDSDDGYYESDNLFASPDSKNGDFVTAADLGPWASLAFADLIVWAWQQLGQPAAWTLVEQGGGSGRLLVDVVAALGTHNIPLPKLYAVERSASLLQRQQALYQDHAIEIEQCATLDQIPNLDVAILMSNELPDAFPVRRFVSRDGTLFEQMVAWNDHSFVWQDNTQPLHNGPEITSKIRAQWPQHYRSEWNPHLAPWLKQCAQVAEKSLLLCVDYGFTQQEYYRPERSDGTLRGHQRHQVVKDVLAEAGVCDITAHVDFTALLKAARAVGFQGSAFMPQWAWLAQSPSVQQQMVAKAAGSDLASLQAIAQAKRLMMPQGMGETFKLLVATKGIPPAVPDYLAPFDRLVSLGRC